MDVSRGDLVIVATRGAYTSKPRPALVVQADVFAETHGSIRAELGGRVEKMTLAIGARLGPYEILSLIGSGGMGESSFEDR
jgi:hypothetical protein